MLSKSQIKLITSLRQKKYRKQHGLFVVEGIKTINELLQSNFKLKYLYTVESFNIDAINEIFISDDDLKRISFLTNPNKALALFEIPDTEKIDESKLIIALDDVRDPGNLGTIIRLCDWFGIMDLVCNIGTVDCYNPKVVQATMGSITRVNVTYLHLSEFLTQHKNTAYGAFMDGKNVYNTPLPNKGILVLGNEANGISKAVEDLIENKIAVPRFGNLVGAESLNVATAAAILLSEFRRQSTET